MAFSSAIVTKTVFGNKRVHFGTFTNASASSVGGSLNTGLRSCEELFLQHTGTPVTADAPVVNATMPLAGSAVAIITIKGGNGHWMAIGY